MEQPSKAKEWSLDEKFKQAKKAGFDAMGGGVVPRSCRALGAKYGLDYICYIDANMKTYKAKLEAAKSVNPARINVQMCDHDTLPAEAVKVWLKLEPLAEKMGLNVDLEVHRDTCTETPEKVYEIAALYKKATGKKLRFCWDYSHIAVVKHISPPYADRLLTHPDLLKLARQVHFRPFNGHHCQIPATDGKGHEHLPGVQALPRFRQRPHRHLAPGRQGRRSPLRLPRVRPDGRLRHQLLPQRLEGRHPPPPKNRANLGRPTSRIGRPKCPSRNSGSPD